MKKLHKRLFLFGIADLIAYLLVFVFRHLPMFRYWVMAKKDVLEQWYPRCGGGLYYFLEYHTAFEKILLVMGLLCAGYLFVAFVGQMKSNKGSSNRLWTFRVLSGLLVMLPVMLLVFVYTHFLNAVDLKDVRINDAINKRNRKYAEANSFGFTDKERIRTKPKGIFRIAVLGDSFVWGDGLPYEEIWSHKLERKLMNEYDSIEVLSWGKCGWSTLDEFNFFKREGSTFGIDLLIVGWVDNDPDVGKVPQVFKQTAEKEFPIISFINPAKANALLNAEQNKDYDAWIKKIYGPENLKCYQEVLDEFGQYTNQTRVKLLFVLTPGPPGAVTKKYFEAVTPIFTKSGIPYFDLYDSTNQKFAHYSDNDLQANAVNAHPGSLMTEEFSRLVKNYLVQNGYLLKVPRK